MATGANHPSSDRNPIFWTGVVVNVNVIGPSQYTFVGERAVIQVFPVMS